MAYKFDSLNLPYDFPATSLYVKRCTHCGLMYFGKTQRKDVLKYTGSGVRWTRHLSKHGNPEVETIWHHLFTDLEHCVMYALFFSVANDVVTSKKWANQTLETGIGGGGRGRVVSEEQRAFISALNSGNTYRLGKSLSDETKLRISVSLKGNPGPRKGVTLSEETKEKLRKSITGKKHSLESRLKMSKSRIGKKFSAERCLRMSIARKGKPGNPHTEESKLKLSISATGKVQSPETRQKIGEANRGKTRSLETRAKLSAYRGKNSSGYNSKWYTDGTTNVKIYDGDKVPRGFVRGRTMPTSITMAASSASKGLLWFNDGIRNFKLDPKSKEACSLTRGRIMETGNDGRFVGKKHKAVSDDSFC